MTTIKKQVLVWAVRAAAGCELELEDGRRLVDGTTVGWRAEGRRTSQLSGRGPTGMPEMHHNSRRPPTL